MANEASGPAPSLLQQYQAWTNPDLGKIGDDRQAFFTDALIVLDTNVLLDLYRYTPEARNQILDALRLVAPRLWLPYQVGLEFVTSRRGVIADRTDKLRKAKSQLDQPFREAWKGVQGALDGVKALLDTFAADEAGQAELDNLINEALFKDLVKPWRQILCERIDELKASQDIGVDNFSDGSDPILPEVAALYGERIGPIPDPHERRSLVEYAVGYRYPNKIPPGYLDAGKPTSLRAAGDYLLWEEMIEHVRNAATLEYVLFVSGDVKADWYEPPGPDSDSWRPWPSLIDEFRTRANADLLIVETKIFFEGISEFLDAKLTSSTVEEISRAAESRDDANDTLEEAVTAKEAATLPLPEGLPLTAYRAAHLSSSTIRSAVTGTSNRLFQWWLVGVTLELALREPNLDEPVVDLLAVVTGELPPSPDWIRGTILHRGEFPAPSSTWIAPWLMQVINTSPRADRASLLRLAQRQLAQRAESSSAGNTWPAPS
ncbi:PIN-like domain-containing protein [Actinomadura sp. DC4]|uniref:PIN-like domain-containing protein n=1 Tax=Actinomadura sp. DC4 TaxID=3055069 RepID=UPI0025B1A1E4|nr:PIN-like domain-containing protein [Actinomadura sp. DC4]MDN3354624.1 PIN-like domain-containing protein [Actinomadura sp. DC4]